ncbi:type II secretion system protein GspN [bacterium]|nr:type II secretion system protein GspN [bacterium]
MATKIGPNIRALIGRFSLQQALIYGAVFGFFFFVTFYLTFPFDMIRQMLVTQLEAKTSTRVIVDELSPLRMSGMELRGVKMVNPDDASKVIIDIEMVRFRLHLLKLLSRRAVIDYDLVAYGGGVSGVAEVRGGGRFATAVNFQDLDLNRYNFAKLVEDYGQLNVFGKVSGHVDVYVDPVVRKASRGDIDVAFNDMRVVNSTILGKELPDINFKPSSIKMDFSGSGVTFEEFNLEGDNLALSLTGRVNLGNTIQSARANLTLKAKPSDQLMDNFQELAMLGSPDREGWYRITVNGPLSDPKVSMR